MKYASSRVKVPDGLSRRQFLKAGGGLGLSAAGLALLEACGASRANLASPTATVETLETTTIRLTETISICAAPLYVAEDFLKAEGFTNVQYVKSVGPGLTVD